MQLTLFSILRSLLWTYFSLNHLYNIQHYWLSVAKVSFCWYLTKYNNLILNRLPHVLYWHSHLRKIFLLLFLFFLNIVFLFVKECVGLFQALPVETWRPKVRDIQTIRNWLLRSAVESCEHQLSRYLLTNINWQYQVRVVFGEPSFFCSYIRSMNNARRKL